MRVILLFGKKVSREWGPPPLRSVTTVKVGKVLRPQHRTILLRHRPDNLLTQLLHILVREGLFR